MLSPIKTLFTYFPLIFFLRVLFLLAIDVGAAVIVYKYYKDKKLKKTKAVAIVSLVAYITVVMFFTLLGRRSLDYYRFGVNVLDYYTQLFSGSAAVDIAELGLNILMFVPIGAIVCFLLKKYKVLWSVVVGLCASLFIELSQLVLRSGFASITDVIHNTIGAFLGGLLGIAIILITKITVSKSQAKVE